MQPDPRESSSPPALQPEVRPPRFEPVRARDRIDSLDVLRGVAILGILVINIVAFGQPMAALGNPIIFGDAGPLDIATWIVAHLFFEQKFISIFSLLFGAGLVLMAERAEAGGARFRGVYYRRLLWLLVIGLAHAYLLWYGDILVTYALCGLLLYPLRRRSPRTLFIIATILLVIPLLLALGFGQVLDAMRGQAATLTELVESGQELTSEQQATLKQWQKTHTKLAPSPDELARQVAAMRGSYGEILTQQIPQAAAVQISTLLMYGLWRVLGLMLIGMALMKLGVLSAARSPRFYRRAAVIGYGLGLPLSGYSAHVLLAYDFEVIPVLSGGMVYGYLASLLVALGHIGVVMLLCQSGALAGLRARLAAVGRTALSNYLLHSVVFTAIFYGFGLGLFGHLSRFALTCLVPLMWLLQLYLSPRWLAAHRFGPAEWLWRTLAYWRRQPMRR